MHVLPHLARCATVTARTDSWLAKGEKEEMDRGKQRRWFLGKSLWAAVGAFFLRPSGSFGSTRTRPPQQGSPEARLRELKLKLPTAPDPVANYVTAVQMGNTLYVSGTGPRAADGSLITGKVGADLTEEEGYQAARAAGLRILATVRKKLGSLDRVERLVKVLGMVNATPDFGEQPKIINGFSDLMVEVFGPDAGKGARSAVGMGSLPFNIPVEIEAIFEIREGS